MGTGTSPQVVTVPWCGGDVIWTATRTDDFVPWENELDSHLAVFLINGRHLTKNRRIESKSTPRDPVRPREMDFFRSGITISGTTLGQVEFLGITIDDKSERLADNRVEMLKNSPPWVVRTYDPSLQPLVLALSASLERHEPTCQLFIDGVASVLASSVMQLVSGTKPTGGLSPTRLRRVLDYINDNLERNLDLACLADCVGLSIPHFTAAFRVSTGTSPHRFILERRIDFAKEMLRQKKFSLLEVALRSGFSSQSHFTTMFHRITGVVPSQFQRDTFP